MSAKACHVLLPQVGYFHSFQDGVDYVFVDHPAYHHWGRECRRRCGPSLGAPRSLPARCCKLPFSTGWLLALDACDTGSQPAPVRARGQLWCQRVLWMMQLVS